MFARFDEIPVMSLQDIKVTICCERTDRQRDAQPHTYTHGQVKTVYPHKKSLQG